MKNDLSDLKEFTLRSVLIGLVLGVILGAANAYLGLKAGMTIAATYPAAVIGMAIIKVLKGNILEENMTRTIGSIGESVAAGAIFTIPAFYISGIWTEFFTWSHYLTATIILICGSLLGILFVALLRRMLVSDHQLPFPESVAAAEIHKSNRNENKNGSKFLFSAMFAGAAVKAFAELKLFAEFWTYFIPFKTRLLTGTSIPTQGGVMLSAPGISPAYMGVGFIIGPKLSAINFSGGLLAWGMLTPLLYFFIAPSLTPELLQQWANTFHQLYPKIAVEDALSNLQNSEFQIDQIWRLIVRPIAIGGMLVGAVYTLYEMRSQLWDGLSRSFSDLKGKKSNQSEVPNHEKDIHIRWVVLGIVSIGIVTFFVTHFWFQTTLQTALVMCLFMIVLGFFMSAISGYLVGLMGSSNNPISGLTLTSLLLTALVLVSLGLDSGTGVATVLGVSAIVCVAAAVAGEMIQDLKVGHILGGTPWKMQLGNIIGIVLSSLVMFFVIDLLHNADIKQGAMENYIGGLGSKNLPAPQSGLMSMLADGIVGGNMSWALIVFGILMGVSFIAMGVSSPMLVCVGMYLPLDTTFAIFIGGMFKGGLDKIMEQRKYDTTMKQNIENIGILLCAGLIAGEALTGLAFAPLKIMGINLPVIFANPSIVVGGSILIVIGLSLVYFPLKFGKNSTK